MSTYITKRARELGLKKSDATAPMKFEVHKVDVARAVQKNSKCCGFARACRRLPKVKAAYFFRSTAWIEYVDGRIVRYMLPPSMQKEIVSFDRNKVMAPGVYQLAAPSKSTRMSAIKKRSAKRPGRHEPAKKATGIKRKFVHRTALIRTAQEPAAAA